MGNMAKRKRSKLEVYLDVLRAVNKGESKPTRIMYKTNLSWVPLQEILDFLVSQDLLREEESSKRKEYFITEKGKRVLAYLNGLANLLPYEVVEIQ
ncbi:MAG: winged helix-turn-helix domain-containing protein [Candidatus Bathyarchaeia archaeon]